MIEAYLLVLSLIMSTLKMLGVVQYNWWVCLAPAIVNFVMYVLVGATSRGGQNHHNDDDS